MLSGLYLFKWTGMVFDVYQLLPGVSDLSFDALL